MANGEVVQLPIDEIEALVSIMTKEQEAANRHEAARRELEKCQRRKREIVISILARHGYDPDDEMLSSWDELREGYVRFIRHPKEAREAEVVQMPQAQP